MPQPIRLDPQNPVVKVGADVTLTAKQDNTPISGGSWTSSDTSIATVTGATNGTATVHGVAPGSATIKVMLGTQSAQVTVMVSAAALTSIAVTPATPTIALGTTTQLTATATFDDGMTMDVTTMATWMSGSTTIATVDNAGTVTSVAKGTGMITATLSGKSGSATVTVTDAALTSIDVTPANPMLSDGQTQQMTATGHFTDDTTQNITASVTWASATTAKATVSATGLVTAVDPGTSVISASMGSITGMTTVTVTAAALTSIVVTPANPTLADGLTQQMTATGHYTDNTTQNLTAQVTWSSATTAKATITAGGLVTAVDPGTSVITATMGTVSGMTTVTVTAAALTSIVVTPANPMLTDGSTQQMTATGHYTDNSTANITATVTWASATPAKATVSPAGLVTAVDPGTSVITATSGTISGSTTVTVTAAALTSIDVTPTNPSIADGLTQQMTATGHYTDNSTANITAMVTWTSATPAKATVNPAGLVTAVDPGTSVVTATLGAISGSTTVTVTAPVLQSIAVTPANPMLEDGTMLQLTATGRYSDTSTANLTAMVTWTSATPAKATITAAGVVTAVDPGTSIITATLGAISGTTTVTVTAAALTAIDVTPADPSLADGLTQQMTATGHYTDNSTQNLTSQVTWTSATPAKATISAAGLVTALDPGTSVITATMGAISGTTTVTVTPAELVSFAVTPANPTIGDGQTQQMTATGRYTDTSTADLTGTVTWTSATPATATVSAAGLVTAEDPGTSVITATLGSVSGSTTVTVSTATLVMIEVTPANPTLADGLTLQMTATGHYSDLTTEDLTAQVTWSSATTIAATVSATGLVTAVDPGSSVITATQGSISSSTTVTVGAAELVSIDVTPANPEVTEGATLPLTATGHYTDGSTQDLTTMVTWASATMATATISVNGLVTGVDPGTSEITATLNAVTGSTTVTVTAIAVTRPTVTATSPADATTEQSSATAIGVTFDMAMDPATLTGQSSEGACSGSLQVSGDNFSTCIGLSAITMSAGDTVATATPSAPLSCGVTYQTRVTTAAMTPGGVTLASTFTTATGFKTTVGVTCATGRLVISQIFGAGSSANAFNSDYVELHNVSNVPVSLNGLALQYASASNGSWSARALPDQTVPAGGYFLIRTTPGTGGTSLPMPDYNTPTQLDMANSNGKIALTRGTAALTGTCPTPIGNIVDWIGYGTANCAEGMSPVTGVSTTKAAFRKDNGCTDTDVNGSDLEALTAAPRNSSTTPVICTNAITVNETGLAEELDFCSLLSPATISVARNTATPAILGKVYEMNVTEAGGASVNVVAQVGYGPSNTNPELALGWTWSAMTYDSQAVNDDVYTGTFTVPVAGTYAYTTRFSLQGGANWTYCDLDGAGSNANLTFSAAKLGVMTVTP
ncbi:MAG: hypothetical protein HOV81_23535 [Kofleriaceae bacterium]|nr:hypothetical protein [Kofleriaceae bacterium]